MSFSPLSVVSVIMGGLFFMYEFMNVCMNVCIGEGGARWAPFWKYPLLSLIHEIFRTSFNLHLRVGIQALLSKGLMLDNCKHSRVNSRFTKISIRPILPRCLGQDDHNMNLLKQMYISA